MAYWEAAIEAANGSTKGMEQTFAASAEYKASIAGANSGQVVSAIYQNMFGHAADAAGLSYWADALTRGAITQDGAVKAIVGGAQGTDLNAYVNKVSAANAFTASLDTAAEILSYSGTVANGTAKVFLAAITNDGSLSHGLGILDNLMPALPSTDAHSAIQQAYVQYFNRPADPAGLAYWEAAIETANGSTTAMSQLFAASAEYKASIAGLDTSHVVGAIYQNMFGHTPDAAGLSYWADALTRGAITIDGAAKAIAGGAQGMDLTTYVNKVSAATAFTASLDTAAKILAYSGTAANAAAKAYLTGITTDTSLSHALAVLDGMVPPDSVSTFGSAAPVNGLLPSLAAVSAHAAAEIAPTDTIVTLVGTNLAHVPDIHVM